MGDKSWVVQINEKLKHSNPSEESQLWKKRSIYRVPACVKDLNRKAYKPQVVSFGPYHHGEDQLMPMEEHKQRALLQFLRSPHGTLHMVPYIKRDMLMLENQLPLRVLERLITVESGITVEGGKSKHVDQIHRLILRFYAPTRSTPVTTVLGLHVLDVFRKSFLQGPSKRSAAHPSHNYPRSDTNDIVRSAMELNEAGIRFKTSRSDSLEDISFHHGVLYLPPIVVDDVTESMFLNLMAFERLHVGAGNQVTSYVFFMDNIIDSSKDVALLNAKGIIQNAVGSDKAVAKLFNSLSKDVTLDQDGPLDEVHRRVNKYCRKSWNMWRANLIHTYFRSPWAFLSLAAAIFLLALTIAQTVYTILPYYNNVC
ncbi:UPF0481 protein [Acorus calamus]|uniref:UPF0481 protein n=1 Tax=Acorus calamus TaxID=4465 RepID=A0AAV9EZ40_ACOCL|nr:UPF0481 protein [Acorus calamus]